MLPEIKTIIYASDLGEKTRPAIKMAASIAEKYQAKVIFLHVIEPITDSARALVRSYIPDSEIDAKVEETKAATLDTMKERIELFYKEELDGKSPEFETEIRVKSGAIEDVILKAAEKEKADLIVMGSRTHSTFGRMIMGSSANKIVHASKVPVLVVPIYD